MHGTTTLNRGSRHEIRPGALAKLSPHGRTGMPVSYCSAKGVSNRRTAVPGSVVARCSFAATMMLALASSGQGGASNEPDNRSSASSGLSGKVIAGYQGWFGCPGDFAGNTSWIHWFSGNVPDAAHLRVELLPDMTEYPPDSLCETDLRRPDGRRISLYSAQYFGAVDLHFRWMGEHG